MKVSFPQLVALLLAATSLGLAQEEKAAFTKDTTLQCFQCTGPPDSECAKNASTLVDCEPGEHCKSIRQQVRGERMVIRKCGFELYKNSTEDVCYKTVHQEYETRVCQCFENKCNGVEAVQAGVMVLAAAAVVALLAV